MGNITHVPVSGRKINADDWHEEHVFDLTAEDVGAAPADHDHDDRYYTEIEIDQMLQALGDTDGAPLNGIVSGCGLAYDSGLTFLMSAGTYYLDGELETAAAQSITLDTADATFDRIDVLYLDNAGTLGKITGTPAAAASQPTLDPTGQLFLTFVHVPAGAVTLPGIVTEVIYDEGVDWAETASDASITIDSTNNPNSGTKDIEGTLVPANAYVKFVRATPLLFDGTGSLLLWIRSKGAWNSKRSLVLRWYLAGVTKGAQVMLKEGTFGFVSAQTSSYQLLIIDKAAFNIPGGTSVDELRLTATGSGGAAIGFYIDPIKLQTTAGTVVQPDLNHAPDLLIPGTISTATYATVPSDRYAAYLVTYAGNCAITLNNAAPIGARIRFKSMHAGGFTFVAGSGMSVLSRDDALVSGGIYSVSEAWRISMTQWSILGDVEA